MLKEEFKQKIKEGNKNILKSYLLSLYKKQELIEKVTNETLHLNSKGFDKNDGPLLTQYSKKLLKGDFLDIRETRILQSKLPRYYNQLKEINIF